MLWQVHVAWLEGGTAVLAFRGTQTAQDGLQDVKIVRQSIDHLQEMFPGTRAHSGEACLSHLSTQLPAPSTLHSHLVLVCCVPWFETAQPT